MASIQNKVTDETVEAEVGSTILESNLDNDIEHPCDCGGNCACSTCKVIVISGGAILSSQDEDERDTLDAYGWDPDEFRLACQCVIKSEGNVVIEFPEPE
ncbi:MAG: 2Fe-2S iron-sulfur cluster-binding protein [Nitrospinota bacterium]|nr:2Fe-2S ferredoxin [Nitrospinota bacterium]MDP6276985.1 2Fe-2S iron-sulfur cluster-binding protein [Nitrospinota bacterium]MDP6367547.1 2Fe-2S iron-sulfur cluster-binding protein [Nitrospinota bacterium]MDP7166736.1 2Fe-2S iron-sulfur cluster-binding protein [Nitrospinota bacterium]MDP7369303.1 2Fe-2S iron-sulfur cluster-binding protein [Nitrospinota bacterium]